MSRSPANGRRLLEHAYESFERGRFEPHVSHGEDNRVEQFLVRNDTTKCVWYGEHRDTDEDGPNHFRILRLDPNYSRGRPDVRNLVPSGKGMTVDPNEFNKREFDSCKCQVLDLDLGTTEGLPAMRVLGRVQDAYHRGGRGQVLAHSTVRGARSLGALYDKHF